MQNEQSQIIVRRFFETIQLLKAEKVIRGKQTFTNRYGINRWNFNTCEKQPERDMFQVAWLYFLVSDYKVSPTWLLTGTPPVFLPEWDADRVKNLQKDCNKKTASQQQS